jgi:hypothetical protein
VAPDISRCIVNNTAGQDVDVHVDGGFAHSALPAKAEWFVGCSQVQNVRGYNPVGLLKAPWSTPPPDAKAAYPGITTARHHFVPSAVSGTVGPGSRHAQPPDHGAFTTSAQLPEPGVRYTVSGTPLTIFFSGKGVGSAPWSARDETVVQMSIFDAEGQTLHSGLRSAEAGVQLRPGWQVSFTNAPIDARVVGW